MKTIIDRIIKWNQARYKQEFNKKLTEDLLIEEVSELIDSELEVEELDALIDIIYVSIGAMWKMGLNATQIYNALTVVCISNESKIVETVESHIKASAVKGDAFIPPENMLQVLLNQRSWD